jgi:hypothetical protein
MTLVQRGHSSRVNNVLGLQASSVGGCTVLEEGYVCMGRGAAGAAVWCLRLPWWPLAAAPQCGGCLPPLMQHKQHSLQLPTAVTDAPRLTSMPWVPSCSPYMYFRSPSQSLAHDRNLTAYYKSLQEQQARGELQDGLVLPSSPAAAETVAAAAARYDMLATDLSDTLLHEPYPTAAAAAATAGAKGEQQQRRQRRSSSISVDQHQHQQQQQRRRPGASSTSSNGGGNVAS